MNAEGSPGTLPGQDLVEQGLRDLAQNQLTECALLVLVAGPRLRGLGIAVPELKLGQPFEHCLYDKIDERLGAGAHSYYNSLVRRVVSYARALARERSRAVDSPAHGAKANTEA